MDKFGLSPVRRNWFHKLVMRITATRLVAGILPKIAPKVDPWVLSKSNGNTTLTSILTGTPVIILTSTGAKSGLPRSTPLLCIEDQGKVILIATNFGQAHHPSWYYNLKKNPVCQVRYKNFARDFIARETTPEEYARYWDEAVQLYAGYQNYRDRITTRMTPIMVLEPR